VPTPIPIVLRELARIGSRGGPNRLAYFAGDGAVGDVPFPVFAQELVSSITAAEARARLNVPSFGAVGAILAAAETAAAAELAVPQARPQPIRMPAGYRMEVSERLLGGTGATTSYGIGSIIVSPHRQRWEGRSYDGMQVRVSSLSANNIRLLLYASDADNLASGLLWSGDISAGTTGDKFVAFASGAWTALGDALRAGTQLVTPAYGSVLWKGVVLLGGVTVGLYTLSEGTVEQQGWPETGFGTTSAGIALITSPGGHTGAPPDPFPAYVARGQQVPMIGLRYP